MIFENNVLCFRFHLLDEFLHLFGILFQIITDRERRKHVEHVLIESFLGKHRRDVFHICRTVDQI